jgi:hypothetical protein
MILLSEEYFDNQAQKWIIKEILNYYDKYHTTPSMDVLKVELQKVLIMKYYKYQLKNN